MERGLSEQSTSLGFCSRIQQLEPNFFRSQARGSDQRRVALAVSLEIDIRPACISASISGSSCPFVACLRIACPKHSGVDE
jgi:hypothetical protein